MFAALSGLLGLLPTLSNTIDKITSAIANERIAQINAKTDLEKTVSEERIKTLEAKRDVLIADAGHSNWDLVGRMLLTGPVVFYLTKVLIIDKSMHWGTTDPLDSNGWWYVTAVVGFYFLAEGAKSVTRLMRS